MAKYGSVVSDMASGAHDGKAHIDLFFKSASESIAVAYFNATIAIPEPETRQVQEP